MAMPGLLPLSPDRLALLDGHLARAAADLFAHDHRLRGVPVDVRFDGGVAHLTGVADPAQLGLVRELVGRLAGVLGVWSRVRVGGREPVALDLGCGATKQYSSSIGVDRVPAKAVDVRADLRHPLPFATGCADAIFAVHVVEHLVDFLPLLAECHRVLRPGGTLHLLSPWWRFVNAVADPTHVRLIDVQTVKGICDGTGGGPRWYPLHAGCDGASVFADLSPLGPNDPGADPARLARFFD
jgi:SAM-dependent methyltransferase